MTEGSQCQNCGDLWTTKDGGMTCCEAPAPDYSGPQQFSLANGGEPLAAFYILDDRLKALVNGKEYDVGEVLDRLFRPAVDASGPATFTVGESGTYIVDGEMMELKRGDSVVVADCVDFLTLDKVKP